MEKKYRVGKIQTYKFCELGLTFYQWPALSTSALQSDQRLMQRAHLVLAWLVNFYVHSIPENDSETVRVPRALAVPLVEVSRALRIAPVLTFADTVLWNWELNKSQSPGFHRKHAFRKSSFLVPTTSAIFTLLRHEQNLSA
jgi:hypothetical protein